MRLKIGKKLRTASPQNLVVPMKKSLTKITIAYVILNHINFIIISGVRATKIT